MLKKAVSPAAGAARGAHSPQAVGCVQQVAWLTFQGSLPVRPKSLSQPAPRETRYVQVARRIAELIRKGSLKPGARVPSIRRSARERGVSIATVIEAYRLLEDEGWIEARPQSGYYVRPKHFRARVESDPPPEPDLQPTPLTAGPVQAEEALHRNMTVSRRRNVIPLGSALPAPEFLPTQQLNRMLARAVRENSSLASQYEVSPGLEELRIQIARRAIEAGCTLGPDDLIITAGATEAVNLSLRVLTQPGDTVIVESPCYFGLLFLLRCLKLRAIEVSTHPRTGISLDALERLLARQPHLAAAVLNPNVQNPLGGIMPTDSKQRLVELLAQHKIPIVEDDTHGELAFEVPRPKCLKAFDTRGRVVLCGSFSKVLAPGYRIGWVAGGRWHARINALKLGTSLACATPPQVAVARFLKSGGFDHHLRKLRKSYREQAQLVGDAVCRSFPDGTRATRPAGGHVLWVQLPPAVDAFVLEQRMAEQRINIAPGPIFSARGRYRNFIRLNTAIPWSSRLESAIAAIGRVAKELSLPSTK